MTKAKARGPLDPAVKPYDDFADMLACQAGGLSDVVWDDLVDRLATFDVTYLGGGSADAGRPSPYGGRSRVDLGRLIRDLARAPEPRLRDALVGLLLRHPEDSPAVHAAVAAMPPDDPARTSLTARLLVAAALQRRHRRSLARQFPGHMLIDITDTVRKLRLPSPALADGNELLRAAQALVAGGHPWLDYIDGWEDVAQHVLRESAGSGSYTRRDPIT